MNIRFLGAAQEVGRSAILVDSGRHKTLLDCGVKLGKEEEFPLLDKGVIKSLDNVVLSHAHLDHSGFLPALYAQGYRKKVVCTKPTRDLIQLLLADYLRINQEKAVYSLEDVTRLLTRTDIMEYNTEVKGITLFEAGHILGSAMTQIKSGKHTLLYTGDLNTRPSRLLEPAASQMQADTLIIESTYGGHGDKHLATKDSSKMLVDSIQATVEHGGKVIIPTFAIGRGQEILFTLENYLRSGGLRHTPVYLDGMIKKALKIYRHNAIYLKKEVQHRILTSDDDPFKSPFYKFPERKDRSDVFEQPTAIILTTSGMLNGGPVLSYLKKLAPDRKNKVILVGFQAKGTRGRLLLEGTDELQIDDEKVPINLEVDEARFSAHSDQGELLKFIKGIKGLKNVFIQHGESEKCEEFSQAITKQNKKLRVEVPQLGEEFKV
ncbi:MAG: MBL fold metallo-hydrolase RNA specificity domain-containing protein [Candidatus Micrarchaeota archaeon]